ncbi:hypothetical protein [Clavibacter sp. VKM Ac-2542]|nr:hypothetical protein [Clavibacter sp. VKM Ac-2542]MBF4619833.1 hypothetical protein [Clavibacter sp. VKM Ac-2542]
MLRSELLTAWTLGSQRILWIAALLGGLVGTGTALVFVEVLAAVGGAAASEVDGLISRASVSGAATVAMLLGLSSIHLSAGQRSTGRQRLTHQMVPATSRTFVARVAVAGGIATCVAVAAFLTGAILVVGVCALTGRTADALSARGLGIVACTTAGVTLTVVLAAAVGLVARHGVVGATAFLGIMVIGPAALGTVGATASVEALSWAATALPAGRLGAVVESAAAGDAEGALGALAALLGWAAAALGLAYAAWRAEGHTRTSRGQATQGHPR